MAESVANVVPFKKAGVPKKIKKPKKAKDNKINWAKAHKMALPAVVAILEALGHVKGARPYTSSLKVLATASGSLLTDDRDELILKIKKTRKQLLATKDPRDMAAVQKKLYDYVDQLVAS